MTLEWGAPEGSGPEAVVDNYTIAISPSPLFPSEVNRVPNLPRTFDVTLEYNTVYVATITAENCAGESAAFGLTGIEYGTYL